MNILDGFSTLFSNGAAVGFVVLGAFIGTIFGAIPGLTAAAAIAMLVPVTYYLDPLSALAFLYVIGKSGRYGGSISAILFNTPGTASAAATQLDGYPMARRGQSGKALKAATAASVFGDFTGELILIFGAVAISSVTEKFGPPEFFAVYAMAFVVISSVISDSIVKGLVSTFFGILIATIGIDPISGNERLTFDVFDLQSGVVLIPMLIGMLVLSEVAIQAENTRKKVREADDDTISDNPDDHRFTLPEFITCLPIMIRSALTGAFIGILPGLGSAVAAFVAYGEEKRRSKIRKKWGTGIVEGIVAPETANNAVSGPTMIPLLALGVPGSTIAAIMIGVFLIHGIEVGPRIFLTSGEIVYGLFAAGLLGIASYGLMGWFGGAFIGRMISKIPTEKIYPYIVLTCFVSAYSARSSVFDVILMCAAGVVGYAMRKGGFSVGAFIIAFVLTSGAEEALRQSLILSDAGPFIFFERPVAMLFFVIGFATMAFRFWKARQNAGAEV
ncbi:tripartite tricarboxylate transporter permease [Oceaniglobus trochenteri]|uniref:tripartite tricarboxylate transporter permease n=1 Tax=Oceaniglobus trochenteri TaxID=2763260 RepID=UPI001CFFE87B|nr:tripartite tricarboxylate transporter permease [Oceaniglobus trochenteri]